MIRLEEILRKPELDKEDLVGLLSAEDCSGEELLRSAAEAVLLRECGDEVFFRGLIEFSNICTCDCRYCGIRKSNAAVQRYTLAKEEILEAARWCAAQGYGSVVLQSGERRDAPFVDFVEDVVRSIKEQTRSEKLPGGLGITLSVGEQSTETLRRFFDAGAHRYLLRIESSSPALFSRIHPSSQRIETRIECLKTLREVGFQVGTGVMIGLPGQTCDDLAEDILFFKGMDVDMIGMGPYIVHSRTPMRIHAAALSQSKESVFHRSLRMIAATRLALRDVNIAATTALGAMRDNGRERGLAYGANVIMPQLTPTAVRRNYLLYEGKPCLDESKEECRGCLENRIMSIGRRIGRDRWGDSAHAARRHGWNDGGERRP